MKNDTGTATAEAAEAEEAATSTPNIVDIAKKDELSDLGYRTEHLKNGWVAYEMLGDSRVPEAGDGFASLNELVAAVREKVQENGISPGSDDFETVDLEGIDGSLDEIERVMNGEPRSTIAFVDEGDSDEIDDDDDFATAPAGEIETIEELSGRRALPGMGHVNNPELTAAALKYHSVKLERCKLTADEKAAKDELKIVSARHEAAFFPDPENTGSLIYIAGMTADGKNIIVRDLKTVKEEITTEEIERKGD